MFGDFNGQSQFSNNYNQFKTSAANNDNDSLMKLIGIGASGYGAEDEQTKRLAYSSFMGNSGYAPESAAMRFLGNRENLLNRLYESASLDNSSLHLPDFLANVNLREMLASARADEVGRQSAYRRTHFNY